MKKIEIWRKFELFDLFKDLDLAEKILAEVKSGYCGLYDSPRDFYLAFKEELEELKHQNTPCFTQMRLWFAPTSIWDDLVGAEGMVLANRILERATAWDAEHI